MDTAAGEIIAQAFREGGFLDGKHDNAPEELIEALPKLNNLLFSLVGVELGERYQDWPIPGTDESLAQIRQQGFMQEGYAVRGRAWQNPPANRRLMVSNSDAAEVYFPCNPMDGARMAYIDVGASANVTLYGNGRLIQGLPSITGKAGRRRWFYRADQGNWVCLARLSSVNSRLPLPSEFDDLFVSGLIIRLAPQYGKSAAAEVGARYADMLDRLKKRYWQTESISSGTPGAFPITSSPLW